MFVIFVIQPNARNILPYEVVPLRMDGGNVTNISDLLSIVPCACCEHHAS